MRKHGLKRRAAALKKSELGSYLNRVINIKFVVKVKIMRFMTGTGYPFFLENVLDSAGPVTVTLC